MCQSQASNCAAWGCGAGGQGRRGAGNRGEKGARGRRRKKKTNARKTASGRSLRPPVPPLLTFALLQVARRRHGGVNGGRPPAGRVGRVGRRRQHAVRGGSVLAVRRAARGQRLPQARCRRHVGRAGGAVASSVHGERPPTCVLLVVGRLPAGGRGSARTRCGEGGAQCARRRAWRRRRERGVGVGE